MREAAVVCECHDRAFEAPEHVEIGSLGRECHGGGSQGRFAIESSSRQNCAGQKVGDGFQVNFVTQGKMWHPTSTSGMAGVDARHYTVSTQLRMILRHEYRHRIRDHR